jgi:hypothetical protein
MTATYHAPKVKAVIVERNAEGRPIAVMHICAYKEPDGTECGRRVTDGRHTGLPPTRKENA